MNQDEAVREGIKQAFSETARRLLPESVTSCVIAFKDFLNQIEYKVCSATRAAEESAKAQGRPSVLYRPTLTFHSAWIVSYGGFKASGSTPAEAMTNFDKSWGELKGKD